VHHSQSFDTLIEEQSLLHILREILFISMGPERCLMFIL